MADFNGQEVAAALGAEAGGSDPIPADQLVTQLGSAAAAAAAIEAHQLLSESDAKAWYFKMRGIDSSGGYTTWVVLGKPDPDGLQATRLNTVPLLTGSVVAGSGVVVAKWGDVFPDGSG
jgi:hypothetical protein